MIIVATANREQIDEIDVTVSMCMKMKQWKMILSSVRKDNSNQYNWTKEEFANKVEQVIKALEGQLVNEIKL